MSQATNWSVPLSGPVPPDEMADRMDKSFDALLSGHSGSSRPSYAVAGTEWVSTATAGKLKKYVYDGANDRLVETIDIATGAITYGNGTVDDVLATKAPKSVYAAKSGSYVSVVGDAGKTLRFTAAGTLSLTAGATLGNGWSVNVVADGGAVTIDPNGSETINGLATLVIPNGSSAEIICDGSNFFTVFKPPIWEPIGVFSVAAAASIIVTDLAAARFLRIKGRISQVSSGIIVAQFSTDNGATYDTGSNYFSQSQFAAVSTPSASRLATTTGLVLSANGASDANSDLPFNADIFDFNQNINCAGLVQSGPSIGSSRYVANLSVFHLTSTARNALRILNAGGGNISGTIAVEMMR
jgi:hypothetical protein